MSQHQTIGSYLRAVRLARKVSIEKAADDTRIRADFLMRMESDEFDYLAPAYVRGFLRAYARYLRVDPEPLLQDFDRRHGIARIDTAQITALQRRPAKTRIRDPIRLKKSTIVLLVAAGALGLFAVVGLLSEPEDDESRRRVAATPSGEASTQTIPADGVSPTATTDQVSFADGIEVELVGARSPCWVTVSVDGVVAFKGTLDVGETAGPFSGEDEIDILLGNAYGPDIVVNGHTLGPVGGEGEVKPITLPDDFEALS